VASTTDAQAGWELYRNSGFALSKDDVNDRLERMGYAAISDRTFEHYRRLRVRGFRRYIPINRLDTMNLPDPFRDESIRSRYAYSEANVPTQIIIHQRDGQIEVVARADVLSDFGTELVVDDARQIEALRQNPPADATPVTVNFLQPPATVYGTVDFVSTLDPNQIRIGVVFRRLIPVHQITGARTLGVQSIRFIVGEDLGDPPLDVISQDVFWLFQAIESARGLVNLMLNALTPEEIRSPPPVVEHLEVASPLDTVLKLSIQIYLGIGTFLDKIVSVGDKTKGVRDAITKRPITEAHAKYIREVTNGVRLDNERKAIANDVLSAVAASLIEEIEANGLQSRSRPDYNGERLMEVLFDDLDPPLRQLAGRGLSLDENPGPRSRHAELPEVQQQLDLPDSSPDDEGSRAERPDGR
jgi:hypothetical protein